MKKSDSSSTIVRDAVKDAKALKELAVDAAKNQLLEAMAPQVRALVERELKKSLRSEDVDRLRRAKDGHGETEFEEGADRGDQEMPKDDKELDMESLAAMFPGLSEMDDEMPYEAHKEPDGDEASACPPPAEEPELEAAGIPTLGEGEKEEEGEMDEEIEISEAELKKVYEQALQAEAMVSKGFKDMSPAGELQDVDPNAGLHDIKKGETHWDQKVALPPAKKDWTVKEVKALVEQGLAENKKLRETNSKLVETVKLLGAKLAETNLFNSKVLHVNQMLSRVRLTKEQKRVVIESIDRATSIDEVKKIYSTLESTLRVAGVVAEARKPKANQQGARKSGGANQEVLRESADKSAGHQYSRWAQLAGLVK